MTAYSNGVKMKHFTVLLCGIIALTYIFCGCTRISEDATLGDIPTAQTILTENTTVSEVSATETEPTETTATQSEETTVNEPSDTAESEITDTEPSETEETTLESEEPLHTENTENYSLSETTAETVATIQTESPPEPTWTETTTEKVTETEAVRAVTGYNSYSALNYREQKGIWISYLEYDSILKNKSSTQFRTAIGEYFDNVKALSFNTVYVQVRAYGDAYYNSELFPSGDRFNGTMGTSDSFDALQIMLDEAHSRGLSVHAWINPMRLMTDSQIKSLSDDYAVKKWYNNPDTNGKYIVKSGDRWYLNPAYSAVRQLIADGITEITANYDVDGIQIDDYFYPTTAASFDKSAYSNSGTSLSLSDWRIKNVSDMVKILCQATHSANSTAVFGISPQGSVDNNYNELYADVKKWCSSSGYCDYILPQVYFGFDNAALPYADTISTWSAMTSSSSVKLVIGLAGYKIGAEDTYAGAAGKNEWINNSDVISRQMTLAKTLDNYGGVAIFRYGSIFTPSSSVSKQVSKELENIEK